MAPPSLSSGSPSQRSFPPCSNTSRWSDSPASCPVSPTLLASVSLSLLPPDGETHPARMMAVKEILPFPLCSQEKTEERQQALETKMNEILALALLCTDTGRRGVYVCVSTGERDGEREMEGREKDRMGKRDCESFAEL